MKANELRIGNYIIQSPEFDWYKPFQVESIGKDGINISATDDGKPYGMHMAELDYEHKYTDIFGVPLTEEWLLKFGFDRIKSITRYEVSIHENANLELTTFKGDFWDCLIVLKKNDSGVWIRAIEYVHQLQDLYFALTGTELNLDTER